MNPLLIEAFGRSSAVPAGLQSTAAVGGSGGCCDVEARWPKENNAGGPFACLQPDGSRRVDRTILDFVYLGRCMTSELPAAVKRGMVEFFATYSYRPKTVFTPSHLVTPTSQPPSCPAFGASVPTTRHRTTAGRRAPPRCWCGSASGSGRSSGCVASKS